MSQATLSTEPYLNSNLFSGYYLDNRIDELEAWDCDEQAQEAFDELQELWDLEQDLVTSYKEDELLDSWIDEVLDVLGFGTLSETTLPNSGGYNDRLLFESDEKRRDAAMMKKDGNATGMYSLSSAVLEAKQWNADFTRRFNEDRSYRDASHQIKYYLERTPERLQWGILTDGRKWRLYGTKDYATETYYEVDLPELLVSGDLEAFKYFYVFFQPSAFRETAGTSFLDTVWNESETAAQELGEDLQDNVFTALRVLGEGFVETNDLDIDPEDEKEREKLKEQSLVLLYRLMFVLYAESRHLISPDDPDAKDDYRENFSLDQLRLEIHERIESGDTFEDFSEFSTSMWSRLRDLFRLVDTGQESLGIPPYNGGLFDDDKHEFLADHQVSDRYVAEVIYRLGTTETSEGSFVLADYADLDTRHLGTIYEGLLEHEFRIAPEQYAAVSADGGQVWKPATEVSVADAVETVERGELYVVNDDGERKATGAYYTPDYVVTYIVEETVDPLLDEIDSDLQDDGLEPSDREYFMRFWQRVQQLKVLDPAMGSGHFLTKATGYLTEQVMKVVREQELQSYDEQEFRRDIAKECIYGVDINGMAVELAKLSMWLETLATDQPLAFLDHHMKTGNSLVGSDITEVLSNGAEENGGQLTLVQAFAKVRERTLEHVMDLMADLLAIENKKLEEIKSMEAIYDEIRADPLYQRLFEMANVHTAERFDLKVPEDAYELMAQAIEDESEWAEIQEKDWFKTAQAMADDEDFFHWELEFPEVFFGGDGGKLEDAGFDAVVGNPPYVRQEQLSVAKPFFSNRYSTFDSAADLYVYFIERCYETLREQGSLGYIVSNKFIHAEYGEELRSLLSTHTEIRQAIDFHSLPVFGSSVSAYPLILIFDKGTPPESTQTLVAKVPSLNFDDLAAQVDGVSYEVPQDSFSEGNWRIQDPEISRTINRLVSNSDKLSGYLDIELRRGILTGLNDAFILGESELAGLDPDTEHLYSLLKGRDIARYRVKYNNRHVIAIPSGWTKQKSGATTEEEAWEWFKTEYPKLADHLSNYKSKAISRHDRGECWWELRPCDYYKELENPKIVYPVIAKGPNFAMDLQGHYINDKLYAIPKEDYSLLAVLNSTLTQFWVQAELSGLRGGYQEFRAVHVEKIPINTSIDENERLAELAEDAVIWRNKKESLNLSLLDHLGSYTDGKPLAKIGFLQPPENAADSILNETAEQKPNLRVGHAEVVHESPTSVEIRLTARYKPEDEEGHETDQWGYTETDPLPALRISDLTETEVDLIEAFVPVAVDEAGGFANFRETATKTNSLIDRLRSLTLPRVDDVEAGLADYIETKARAEELEAKIERTDGLIDEIVYELYGLTDEEIAIVEEAVGK